MSQTLRSLWQALYTVVGGDPRWLSTSLTPPSRSQGRTNGGNRPPAAAPDGGPKIDDDGPEANEADGPEIDDADESETDDADGSSDAGDPEAAIIAALTASGGRLDQREIPEAAGLSQSTVSRRLIALEERGDVNRYEIGRRKVVFIPGEEPDAFDSPLQGDETPPETPS